MGIPMTRLVITPDRQGTWVHPDVAVNLGQWVSPKFAVLVSRSVREWMSGRPRPGEHNLPYHMRRLLANPVPPTHFSILGEQIVGLVAPMERVGYCLPENMLPDISEGRMFARWL